MSSRVVVVGDDPENTSLLARVLANGGYDTLTPGDVDDAVSALHDWQPAAILTDLHLPLVGVIDLCTRVRQLSKVPILVLSTNTEVGAEVAVLDAGADAYINKPFNGAKLLAHLRAALRRNVNGPEPSALGVGAFVIDFHDRRVRVHGQPVRLTPKEFDLFVYLARNPNRVIPHKTLLGAVWGEASEDQSEYLRVFVGQLRKKFESNPSRPQYLVTEPWVGYRFNPTGLVQ